MHDTWFADEERVRKAVGLLEKPIVQHPNAREERQGFFLFVKGLDFKVPLSDEVFFIH